MNFTRRLQVLVMGLGCRAHLEETLKERQLDIRTVSFKKYRVRKVIFFFH